MSDSVVVGVRVRPLNSKEKKEKCTEIQKISGKSITVTDPASSKNTKTYSFDYVYGPTTEQKTVFNDVGLLYLENAWKGFNCTLFAYGQTGAGKSFSMTGDMASEATRGIIPRGCEEMFNRIKSNTDENVSYEVRVSFLEMYNEKLQDLLDPKTAKTISVRESTKKGIYIENALEEPVDSYEDINQLLEEGNKSRTVAATAMNATSSRSHSVLTIFFTRKEKKGTATTQRESKINLVDLAGSERQSKTGATGERLTEAAAINKSLSALGNVIKALADISQGKKNIFVPYRDSLLTRMLQDSLGGNSKTIMIAAMSPASSNYDEGISTLQYADRAKQIKNKPVVNESETDKLIRNLQEEIAALKAQLGGGGAVSSGQQSGLSPEEEARLAEEEKKREEELDKQRQELAALQEETALMEAKLAQEKADLDSKLASLQGKEETAESKALKQKLAQLEEERKKLAEKAESESEKEEALLEKQAEADRIRQEKEEAAADLQAALKQISDMTSSTEEKKARVEEARRKRKEYLADMGLSIAETAEAAGLKKDRPFLTNMSLSRDMAGNLIYILHEDKETTLGSDSKLAQIVTKSIGVEPLHGTFKYDVKAQKVTLTAAANTKILVNGKWINGGEKADLKPGDRLIFGRAFCLRFVFEKMEHVKAMDPEEESQLIQAEMAIAAGKCRSVEEFMDKDGTKLALLNADMLIDEANEIAQKLGRKINFSMDILADGRSVNVKVNSFEHNGTQEWALSVLENRIQTMREILLDFAEDGVIDNPPEKDPFFNPPPDMLIGTASILLKNVILAGAMRVTLGVKRREKGKDKIVGQLKMSMTLMTRENGKDVKLKLVEAGKDSFVISESGTTGKVTKTRLKKEVDRKWLIGKELVAILELISVQLQKEEELSSDGLFVSFAFPADRAENTERSTDKGLVRRLQKEGNTTAGSALYRVEFPSVTEQTLDYFMKEKVLLDVWGHEAFDAAYPTNGTPEEMELARLKRELEQARALNQKTRFEIQGIEQLFQQKQSEYDQLKAETDELAAKSKSCVIF
ncbi:putative Kinesin-II 85 kDa subunit [Blattamonas nauphoetae]|uniref:Kinesin-II 85 kDa subunit n=1 Tax=Blattamonas nauphoetae TaxID=2049346 RepID=A0ABQ9X9T6_9EUKA|nr:putative Kinesin-II 85 kDa subunit [Blattamonas nauphoetae]